jgi:RNA polymerase sigma-70 factor (ECF subfamily)
MAYIPWALALLRVGYPSPFASMRLDKLVEEARHGNRDAFRRLADHYRPRLEAFVRSRWKLSAAGALEVEDVLQETLLRALGSLESFEWRDEESFIRWLTGIARVVMLQGRDRGRRDRLRPLADDIPASALSQSRVLRRAERFDRLEAALRTLSPDHRQVIILAQVKKLPMKEVAKSMGRSTGAASNLLMRAIERLREAFGETESLHLPPRALGGEEPGRA